MRTTVNLDDDILQLVKSYAEAHSVAMGKALSELVRRGVGAPPRTRKVNGLVIFDLPEDTKPLTSEQVKKLEAESW
jgi:hypothetical protein